MKHKNKNTNVKVLTMTRNLLKWLRAAKKPVAGKHPEDTKKKK
jgi:hypothetical protein